MQKERFLERFSKEIDDGTAAVFAGAGLSVSAGYVDWKTLLAEIARDLGLDIEREDDLVGLAQFHVNRHGGNRGHLNQLILEEFPADVEPTDAQRIVAKLPIRTIWTTNYDRLIEAALEAEQKIADVKFQVSQLAHTKPRRDATVYKMHGDVENPASAVITRDDYESYERDRGVFLNALAGDLTAKTFLFLGFSFTDPNLERILAHIRVRFKENQRPHYAIFKKIARGDFEGENADIDFDYARTKQTLVLEDLRRFNINAVLVDEYAEITELLRELYRRHRARYVFVSTAAADFSPWGEEEVMRFMATLGKLIAQQGFRLVSGVGLGTGSALLGGALYEITGDARKKLDHDLIIRPFPQHFPDAAERERHWAAYRKEMIGRAGLALFLFGNKFVDGEVVLSDGMRAEYEIARDEGLTTLPIAATGGISKVLSDEQVEDGYRGCSPEVAEQLQKLPDTVERLDELLGPIMDLLDATRNAMA